MKIKIKKQPKHQHIGYDPSVDGITQSKLTTWRTCPTKARYTNKGIAPINTSMALTFGSIFHEYLDVFQSGVKAGDIDEKNYMDVMKVVCSQGEKRMRDQMTGLTSKDMQDFETSIAIIDMMFPIYIKYWSSDMFGKTRKNWIEIEKEFKIDHKSGAVVRGKRDGLYEDDNKDFWLLENKTKGQFNEQNISLMIERDLQVNLYLWAVEQEYKRKAKGVLYNIIRRPQLRKKVSESLQQYVQRIHDDIINRPDFYFLRLQVSIPEDQKKRFGQKLDIELAEYVRWCNDDPHDDKEYTHNCISSWGVCPFIKLCGSGGKNMEGLKVMDDHNPELKG